MKWLGTGFAILLCLVYSACGSSETDTTAVSDPAGSDNQGQLAGGSELTYQGTTIGRCQTVPATELDETPDAGLQLACDDADSRRFDFEAHTVVVLEDTGRNATVRVSGFSESCEIHCPGEIYNDFQLFVDNSGRWAMRSSGIWQETVEERATDAAVVKSEVDQIDCQVVDNQLILSEGGLEAEVQLSRWEHNYSVELQVDLPGYSGAVFLNASPRQGMRLEFSPSQISQQDGVYDLALEHDGESVSVTACRVVSDSLVKGEWQTQ